MPPGVTRDTALALERIERLAWRDQLEAATATDRDRLGLRHAEVAGALVMAADRLDSLIGNRVLGLGLAAPVTDAALEALLAHFGEDRSFAVNLCPFAQPEDAGDVLARRGFATFFHHLKWVRTGAAPLPAVTALDVVAIGGDRAHEWESLYAGVHDLAPEYAAWSARVVGRAGWTHHVAYDQGRPVAASAMYRDGTLAWLGKTGTLESHRRLGAQAALLAARLRAGIEAGVRVFTLETAPDWPDLPGGSLRNAARAGFHPAYERPSWVHGHRP